MSAFGGKADGDHRPAEGPLIAKSGRHLTGGYTLLVLVEVFLKLGHFVSGFLKLILRVEAEKLGS